MDKITNKKSVPTELKGLFGKHRIQVGIGDLAKMTGVPQSKIRYWEQKGYIQSVQNDEGQNHKYSFFMMGKVHLINHYLEEGFTLTMAVKKADRHKEVMDMITQVATDRFESLELFNGLPAVNLGPVEELAGKSVVAVIEDGKTRLHLTDTLA